MTPDYTSILVLDFPGCQWSLENNDLSTLTWDKTNPVKKPTQKVLDDAWPRVNYALQFSFIESQRRTRYQAETDGMFFAAQREGGDLTAWTAAVDQIKADLPYPEETK